MPLELQRAISYDELVCHLSANLSDFLQQNARYFEPRIYENLG